MNKTVAKIKKLVTNTLVLGNIRIDMSDLEDKGTLFYMNDRNGTEFDWHVNHRLPYLMALYNDEANMGAIKVGVYDDCKVAMYFYGDSGKTLVKEVECDLDCSERELLELAVLLKSIEDKGNFWNKSIESISSLHLISQKQIDKFLENKALYEPTIKRMQIMNMRCYVSKKILDEGWKIGLMVRDEALNDMDSGWAFMVGNEDDSYANNADNIYLLAVGQACQIDPDILGYIDNPVGTALIRISDTEFEVDNGTKAIYLAKREDAD